MNSWAVEPTEKKKTLEGREEASHIYLSRPGWKRPGLRGLLFRASLYAGTVGSDCSMNPIAESHSSSASATATAAARNREWLS